VERNLLKINKKILTALEKKKDNGKKIFLIKKIESKKNFREIIA